MTTNEVAPYENPGGVQIFDQQSAPNRVMEQLQQHADAMSLAFDLATKMCKTELVPKIYRNKAENGTAAILYGMEIGLNPIQALQNIFVVHGTPAIYARTMVGLVKSKGYQVWTVESTDESVTVSGRARGDDHETTSTWTIERAKKAGYVATPTEGSQFRPDVKSDWVTVTKTSNNGSYESIVGNTKYVTDPQAMLYAKAASEVCRKIAPEVLLGLAHSAEDLQSEPEPVQAQSSRGPAQSDGWQDRLGVGAGAQKQSGWQDRVVVNETEPDAPAEKAEKDEAAPEPEPAKDEPKKRAPAAKTQAKPTEKTEPVKASEPSDDGAKQDTAQAKAPSYTIPKDAATAEQLTELARLLDEDGGAPTPEAKLDWINSTFTTAYINARQMTSKQAADAIKFLSATPAAGSQ
ncbi:hypothetical protein CH263_13355 [Rhodococcus sp. 06-1059B-a]|nr:hypothetical protein [Rhodococcus sp. 06-1059B-a]OZD65125.1 hypothetical protein CH263_13355 [Rhodococcus sp. 06-1059B-a]